MRRKGGHIVVAAATLLLALVLAGCAGSDPVRDAEPGSCLARTDSTAVEFEAADCADSATAAKYLVLAVQEGETTCADQPDTDWALSFLGNDAVTACLRLQPEADECFRGTDDQYWGTYIACEDGGSRVVAIVDGTTADVCETGQWGRVYSDDTVLCFEPASL